MKFEYRGYSSNTTQVQIGELPSKWIGHIENVESHIEFEGATVEYAYHAFKCQVEKLLLKGDPDKRRVDWMESMMRSEGELNEGETLRDLIDGEMAGKNNDY